MAFLKAKYVSTILVLLFFVICFFILAAEAGENKRVAKAYQAYYACIEYNTRGETDVAKVHLEKAKCEQQLVNF